MKLAFAALTCVCSLATSALAQDSPPTAVERLAAFGFPFDEEGNPGVGRVRMGDTDMYVLGANYATVRNGQILRSGALTFAVVDDNTVEMILFGAADRYEYTFVSAEISDSGLFASGDIVLNGGGRSARSAEWYDFTHVHAEIIDGDIIPITGDVSQKQCRCACPDGTSNATGCTPDMCTWQNPCTGSPCPAQQEPAEPAQHGQMALLAAAGTCRWMDPCPPDCGSRELGLALLAAAGLGAALLRRTPFQA